MNVDQPARHTAATITDKTLDQLHAERDRYRLAWIGARRRARNARAAWRTWFRLANKRGKSAEQAEAANARVSAYADRLDQLAAATISAADRSLYSGIATDIHAALNEPKEQL